MLVTELGMEMPVKAVQPIKALFPMLVTELGMEMPVKAEQSKKAL